MERTYFEIKITFIHILVLIVAIVLIGILLFYMGYKAGNRVNTSAIAKDISSQNEEKLTEYSGKQTTEKKQPALPEDNVTHKTIESEQGVQSQILPTYKDEKTEKGKVAISHYTIRVGAFSNQINARNYAEKFQKRGYLTKISSPEPSAKNGLFYVLIGQFDELEQAKIEKEKLEKLENKKFLIVPNK